MHSYHELAELTTGGNTAVTELQIADVLTFLVGLAAGYGLRIWRVRHLEMEAKRSTSSRSR